MPEDRVVVDTNVFVAAGFNSESASAKVINEVRHKQLRMPWHEDTRCETKRVVSTIPPLSWKSFRDLFRDEDEYTGKLDTEAFGFIPDETDRKFAALAKATDAIVITNDDHLLDHREPADTLIVASQEYYDRLR